MIIRALITAGMLAVAAPWHAAEVGHSARSSWTTPQTLIYRDSAAFRGAWAQLFPATPRPALPAIDFTKSRIIVAAAGNRPTGGFRMALDEAHVAGDSALITVTLFTPPAGCGVMQEITAPAVAIVVPSSPTAFRLITRTRLDTVRCN